MEDNPYRAPTFDDTAQMHARARVGARYRGLSLAEIRAFVGRRAGYYLRKWRPAVAGDTRAQAMEFRRLSLLPDSGFPIGRCTGWH